MPRNLRPPKPNPPELRHNFLKRTATARRQADHKAETPLTKLKRVWDRAQDR
jgi:hypothetical protein